MTADERRTAIRNFISEKRVTSIPELVQEFHSSRSAIKRDLAAIYETTPYESIPGNGGGIRAMDGWYANKTYFSSGQEALIRKLEDVLQNDEERRIYESILNTFVMPRPSKK